MALKVAGDDELSFGAVKHLVTAMDVVFGTQERAVRRVTLFPNSGISRFFQFGKLRLQFGAFGRCRLDDGFEAGDSFGAVLLGAGEGGTNLKGTGR